MEFTTILKSSGFFPGHLEMNPEEQFTCHFYAHFQQPLNWSEGISEKFEGMGGNMQAKTKPPLFLSQEIDFEPKYGFTRTVHVNMITRWYLCTRF